jgi:FtsP/CotA-like multicopper oxidase with cupredoxin domain
MRKGSWKWVIAAAALALAFPGLGTAHAAPLPGGSLDPTSIPKYVDNLVIPPAMPQSPKPTGFTDAYYEISMRQFKQQILPSTGFNFSGKAFPMTTVWSYGSETNLKTVANGGTLFYPSFTIEATADERVRVKWINGLVDDKGRALPHLFPVDETLHWANPPAGSGNQDSMGFNGALFKQAVPMIPHLHGGHSYEWSDGYPEAWFLPDAKNIPPFFAQVGSLYNTFKAEAAGAGSTWGPGFVVFDYPNDQAATTLWFHDHSLGITRLNVYAGPAGFYLLRGGAYDTDLGYNRPSETLGVAQGTNDVITEIPIVIQDRSFNKNGSLFYPDHRKFFDGFTGPFLPAANSDVPPRWNPEFFANSMVVNGRTWPVLNVEPRRYRLRFLNGCNSRFLVLKIVDDLGNLVNGNGERAAVTTVARQFNQIGADGGFLTQGVTLDQLLMGPAERADVIVDFTDMAGATLYLVNDGPDEPFGGFPVELLADKDTTAQIIKIKVGTTVSYDGADPGVLPGPLPAATLPVGGTTRQVSLNEVVSTLFDGPIAALLGTVDVNGVPTPLGWGASITETIPLNNTEVWEIYNFTEDAHPIHVHLVQFAVVNRQALDIQTDENGEITGSSPTGPTSAPESWETQFKDTVIAYPGQITRIRAKFDREGLFVWHCHILEHEDNEMMRPYRIE